MATNDSGKLTRRRLLQGGAAALAATALGPAPAALARTRRSGGEADLILFNGKIVTVDGRSTIARAIAVRDGLILAVGGQGEVMRHSGSRTRRVNLRGRTVIPGLIDSHLHQHGAALNSLNVQLLNARSIADVAAAVGARVADSQPGEWVLGSSAWHESMLQEGRLPTRHDLDPVSPDNPVFLPRGGHVATVNSMTLELAGVDADTPDPDGGRFVRDAAGNPTGVLLQNARHLVAALLPPPPPPAEQAPILREYMAELNAYGITGVTEPGLGDAQFDLYQDLRERGQMSVRTHLLYGARGRDPVLQNTQRFVDRYGSARVEDPMLQIDGLKFQLDGGVEGARLYEPYEIVEGEQTDPDYRGFMFLPAGGFDELVEAGTLAAQHGWQIQTHAVGDETIDTTMDFYEAVDARVSVGALRWAIMHIFLPTPQAIARMKASDIQATVQDHPVLLGHNQQRYWGQERAAYAIPTRDLLAAGLHVGGGTDAPVLPADPFISMWWMVTRKKLDGEVLGADQSIPIERALRLYTIDNAVTQFAEHRKGSLEVGKYADLVVLTDDLLDVPPDAIRDIQAEMTFLGGELVHEAGASSPPRRNSRGRGTAAAAPIWSREAGWRAAIPHAESVHAGCCATL